MIINKTIQGVSSVYAASASVKRALKAEKETAEAGRDEIQLSAQAKDFSAILNKLQSSDTVRQDKVVYYENLIASGNYNVKSSDLADKLLQSRF